MQKANPATCVTGFAFLAEDKRFTQLAVPESASASHWSLGFFDRCAVIALAVSSTGRAWR